jgi:hypothetical protein
VRKANCTGSADLLRSPAPLLAFRQHLQDHVGWGALLFSTADGGQLGRGGAFQKALGAGTQGRWAR